MTPDEVRASIVPKSTQLNADDLLTGPITVTVEKVSRGNAEQPIEVRLKEAKPYFPCKSMRRVLIAAWGDQPSNWIGQRIELFCDPQVKWAGVAVGGIRISAMSGIDKERTFMLTETRGKRTEYTVRPLPSIDLSPEDDMYVSDALQQIADASTPTELEAIKFIIETKPQSVRDRLRQPYMQRAKELA